MIAQSASLATPSHNLLHEKSEFRSMGSETADVRVMPRFTAPSFKHALTGLVAAAALLGLASMIHPSDSSALPVTVVLPDAEVSPSSSGVERVSLGTLEAREAVAELYAATPEPLCDVDWETPMDGLTIDEYLAIEGAPVQETDLEAWPDAFMQVDIGGEW